MTLVLSDVLGDPLDLIASGPTVPNPTSPAHALEVLHRYDPERTLPDRVYDCDCFDKRIDVSSAQIRDRNVHRRPSRKMRSIDRAKLQRTRQRLALIPRWSSATMRWRWMRRAFWPSSLGTTTSCNRQKNAKEPLKRWGGTWQR